MNVVVTGGSGGLGREVVRGLRARGATATAASRRTGVNLATGEGLESALAGAEVIVHAATHPAEVSRRRSGRHPQDHRRTWATGRTRRI